MKHGDLLAAFVAGGAAVLGYAPFSLPVAFAPASLFALAMLVWLLRGPESAGRAALLGGLWGLGFFLAGVSWVYVSMARFSGLPAWAAALATLAFCAWLAVFPALASAAWTRLRRSRPRMSALTFAACWTLAEWLRGSLLTGFPWLAAGYAHTPPSPLAGFAPVAGVYGVGFAAALTAALLARLTDADARGRALAGIATIAAAGALLMHMPWTAPSGAPIRVALLQGDVAQDVKWNPDRLQVSFDRYAGLAAAPGEAGAPPPELLVLPETALPLMFDAVPRSYLSALAGQGALLIGTAVRVDDGGYVNGAVAVSGERPPQVYAKRHLVPFGEYPPPGFRWFFEALRIPMSEFTAGAPQQPPLALAGQRIAPNICYEDLFGEELIGALPQATLLVNLSNTAWFGDSLAQPQHLQIARMRAMETGRDMLRATNSGITALVRPDGSVAAQLPPFRAARLDVPAQGRTGLTPYAKWGNALILGIVALLLAASAVPPRL